MKRCLPFSPFALLVLVLFVLACEGEVISYTPVKLPSPTSYPRLEESEARARIIELFETNGGCRFPCWWGIVPGKTSWEEVHALLSPLMDSEVDRTLGPDDGVLYIDSLYNYGQLYIEVQTNDDLPVTSVLIEDFSSEYLSNLNPSYIFQTYGIPDEIYIRSPHSPYGGEPCRGDFEMFIHYSSKRFAVRYYYRSYAIRQTIRVCGLNRPSFAEYYVWAPSSDSDFQKVASNASWYPGDYEIRTIEETTEWTTASFYTVFQSGTGSEPCIVAPPFEWKHAPNLYSQCEESSP